MITLHILEYLKDNGFGTAIDVDLHFEKLPLGKNGIAIFSRGGERPYGRRRAALNFDLYSRGEDDLNGMNALEKIGEFFADNYDNLCELPKVPGVSNRLYTKVSITTIDNVENIGLDENDRVIFRLAAQITYKKIIEVS